MKLTTELESTRPGNADTVHIMTTTQLSYLAPLPLYDTQKAFAYNYNRGPDVPAAEQSNLEFETHTDIPIRNARLLSKEALALDKYGFRYREHPSSLPRAFSNSKEEVETYINNMKDLVREEFQADHVVCCDFRVGFSSNGNAVC